MSRINLTMGAKGGIGKTLIASTLAQFYQGKGVDVLNVDLDFKNQSFAKFQELNVHALDLETDGDIEKRKFDVLIERMELAAEDAVFVLDCGGNIYIPLNNYMLTNDVYSLILGMGHQLLLHVPIMGGAELDETMDTLDEVARKTPQGVRIAVWLNTYHGIIEQKGKSFEQSQTYKDAKGKIQFLVTIPKFADDMRLDVSEMFKNKMTFDEATVSPSFRLMSRQRIKMARDRLYDAMKLSRVCE